MRVFLLVALFALFLALAQGSWFGYLVPIKFVGTAFLVGYLFGSLKGRSGTYDE